MSLHTKHWIVLGVFFGLPLLTTLIIIIFDIWVYYVWGYEATISQAMKDLPPMLIFAIGFVMGALIFGLACHFWWQIYRGVWR